MTCLSSTTITLLCLCECGTLKPEVIFTPGSDLFLLDICYASLLEGVVFGLWFESINMDLFLYGLKTHHMVMHLHWLLVFLLLLTCPVVYRLHLVCLSRLGIGGHLFFIFGTSVLLLHGTFGVKFVQHMISFHCRLWPFLALLFLWVSSLILDLLVLLVLCFYLE